jgi:long-chain acyl-CoA synthetase
MTTSDPIFEAITGPGSPFEIGARDGMRQFVNAPPDLNMLIEAARAHGDKTFIVEGELRLSYAEAFASRDTLAAELNIARGDRVAIAMKNGAAWMIGFLAIMRAGGVAVLINSRGSADELVAMVGDVSASLVLADADRTRLLREGGYQGRIVEPIIPPRNGEGDRRAAVVEGAVGSTPSVETKVLTRPAPSTGFAGPPPRSGEDLPAAILFTSGTTGRVKGAVLSHKNLIHGIMLMQMSGVMILHGMAKQYGVEVETIRANMPQGAVLQVYPLFHISGLGSAFLSPMFAGSKIVVMNRWDPQEALRQIAAERITMFTGVPTMLWDVLNRAKLDGADLSSITNIGTGGQALPVNLLDAMRETCPQAFMGTGYGLTETSGSVAQAVGEDFIRNRASAGRVLSLVDMKIDAPDGEPGEIVVRGPMVMQGYWNRPEETSAVLSEDGWFRTGDVGYVDGEGYVFIVDRKKDMVISGGENIYCAEVERVMGEMAGVGECAAFGIPDERLGELLVAVAVAPGLSEDAIKGEVGARLARYKAPGRIAFTEQPLPRNAVGKVDKIKLRAMWPELLGE